MDQFIQPHHPRGQAKLADVHQAVTTIRYMPRFNTSCPDTFQWPLKREIKSMPRHSYGIKSFYWQEDINDNSFIAAIGIELFNGERSQMFKCTQDTQLSEIKMISFENETVGSVIAQRYEKFCCV